MNDQLFEHAKNSFLQGLTEMQCGNYSAAKEALLKSLQLIPDRVSTLVNLSAVLIELEEFDAAYAHIMQALKIQPDSEECYLNLGNLSKAQRRYDEAISYYDRALLANDNYQVAYNNKGSLLDQLGRSEEAIACLKRAITIDPEYADAYNNLGALYSKLGQYENAFESFAKSLKYKPDNPDVYNNLGELHRSLKQTNEAFESFAKSLKYKPDNPDVYNNLGELHSSLKQINEAIDSYSRALELKPDLDWVFGKLVHARAKICDWNQYESSINELKVLTSKGAKVCAPFVLFGLPSSLSEQRQAAEQYSEVFYPPLSTSVTYPEKQSDRIKIAYLSADYHNHATAYLTAELFELHDRTKFEVVGVCYGRSPADEMRQRVSRAFDHFFEVEDKTDQEIAELVRSLGVDIAIDLKGHTQDSRLGIFAYRPAPIQLHYLGYPGTLGTDFIDYLVADPVLIPVEDQCFYKEKIVYLPDTYQVNDRARKISDSVGSRSDHGLPENGFVFCCFNNNWKITPDIFSVWIRILNEVEGSVLWLLKDNETVVENLIREAAKKGIGANRLVFAERLPLDQHLARNRHADLFLDTLYCNAHTTASDALWAGLPVLTKIGDTYAGRVAASLLTAIDLPELITNSLEQYQSLAVDLAKNSTQMQSIREKLAINRETTPLFDTPRLTRHLECAYEQIVANYRSNRPPENIYVPVIR